MKFINRIYHSQYYNNIKNRYFIDNLNILEFVVCILLYLLLSVFIVIGPDFLKGISSQIQAFAAVYFTFRFAFLGFKVISIITACEILLMAFEFGESHNFGLIIGITTRFFIIISMFIVAVLSNNRNIQKKKLQYLAVTDELTNVYNQRFFHKTLETEIERVHNNNGTVGLIMLDIDNFKMYNDIYGHDCGDKILVGTASLIKKLINEDEILCRYGGDEFAVILPNKNICDIKKTALRLKNSFEENKSSFYDSYLANKVTISMGISQCPEMSENKSELISQADMALYHAKNSGKNKVHFYQDVILQLRKSISSDHQQLIGVFKGLLSTISAKDKYTLGHCERVSLYAVMIGEALQLQLRDISTLQYAGLLHDIGKIELPKSVLNKTHTLTEDEYKLIREHPTYSANILEPLDDMDQLIDFVKHHHERFDGKGYPDGLISNNISLGARILCVADSFDAMISERPYSKRMETNQALDELKRCAGTHFDPQIVNVLTSIIKSKGSFGSIAM
ncbi:MAG: diguanylate cyclase [Clostridiaceae bacterium]|nr:diguanylate cyclase [Clostridiaceae bacterium]